MLVPSELDQTLCSQCWCHPKWVTLYAVNAGVISIIDNQYGTITNNRCNITWKNINMRQLLGGMYDKYETFNMYLYQVVQSSAFAAVP